MGEKKKINIRKREKEKNGKEKEETVFSREGEHINRCIEGEGRGR